MDENRPPSRPRTQAREAPRASAGPARAPPPTTLRGSESAPRRRRCLRLGLPRPSPTQHPRPSRPRPAPARSGSNPRDGERLEGLESTGSASRTTAASNPRTPTGTRRTRRERRRSRRAARTRRPTTRWRRRRGSIEQTSAATRCPCVRISTQTRSAARTAPPETARISGREDPVVCVTERAEQPTRSRRVRTDVALRVGFDPGEEGAQARTRPRPPTTRRAPCS